MNENEKLRQSIERLKAYGDGSKRFPPYHTGEYSIQYDLRVVANAYMNLGERQPDKICILTQDGELIAVPDGNQPLPAIAFNGKIVRAITFIQPLTTQDHNHGN